LVHRVCHLGSFDHGADRDPLGVLERTDRWRTSARRNSRCVGEYRAGYVVLTDDVLTRSDDARDARGDLVGKRCEVRVLEGEGHGLMASAVVMGGVLMEISKEWEDWGRLTGVGGRGRERGGADGDRERREREREREERGGRGAIGHAR